MEVTGSNLDQMQVLLQTFRPNEPLQAAMSELIATGHHEPRPFTMYGSDERFIDIEDIMRPELNAQKRAADKYLDTQHNVQFKLNSQLEARVLKVNKRGAVALQLVMKPLNSIEYAHIREALDIVKFGHRGHAIGFQATRVYLTIPFDQLRPIPEVKHNLANLTQELGDPNRRHLYQFSPNPFLVEHFAPRRARK